MYHYTIIVSYYGIAGYNTSLHCLVYRYYNIVVNLFQLVYYSHYLKLTDSSCNFLGISTELATKQGHWNIAISYFPFDTYETISPTLPNCWHITLASYIAENCFN